MNYNLWGIFILNMKIFLDAYIFYPVYYSQKILSLLCSSLYFTALTLKHTELFNGINHFDYSELRKENTFFLFFRYMWLFKDVTRQYI